jgi:GH35 family endo-1,4-beta-xylanase
MSDPNRRRFLKHAALAGAALALAPAAFGAPTILTPRRTRPRTAAGTLTFRPYAVQRGVGPHLLDWAYASDAKWDAFLSDITADPETGVAVSDTKGEERFGINARWNVEGFGYTFLTADNGGEMYELPPDGQTRELNLVFELAKSRVARNRRRLSQHTSGGYTSSRETQGLLDLSEGYFEDAERASDEERRAVRAQKALRYALHGGEALELDYARHAIAQRGPRDDFFFGCDTRAFYQMDPDAFMDGFTEVFDYATLTHYLTIGHVGMPDFEPTEGDKRFDTREALFQRLRQRGITVEGRPLYYAYESVTPDWLREKSYDELLRYVENHVREVVGHYGDGMYAWEVVNELHDWANETRLTPDQAVELTKLACDVAKDTAPNVHRLINHCCPFAEYVQLKKWGNLDATHPQRTPWEFLRDLDDAGVDFTITGQQMYFPYRDLQDIVVLLERYESFGRPVQLTEVGVTSGPSRQTVLDGSLGLPTEPHPWHRPWDEDLQADWMEGVYTLAYSKPWIEAANWYDFVDGPSWIDNGGFVRDVQGDRKPIFHRLKALQEEWRAA